MRKQRLINKDWMVALTLVWLSLAAACGQFKVGFETETTDLSLPTEAPVVDGADTSQGEIETATPAAPPAHRASGLVLGSYNISFYVDRAGQVVPLVDYPGAQLSVDKNQLLYAREEASGGMDDIYLLDLESGEERNLTQTPDRGEGAPVWWPAHPELVFFVSGEMQGMGYAENPTVVGLDGSGYQVLDDTQGGPNSLSEDGTMIAYGGFDFEGVIYHWNGQREAFDPAAYGVTVDKVFKPAFSPDGRYLAWKVSGDLNGDGELSTGLAIFDLQEQSAELIHVYTVQGGGMVPHYISWSPDGSWIAYVTFGEGPAVGRESNLWVMRPDGGEETYIDSGLSPTWSPDGQQLAYVRATMSGEIGLHIAETGSWAHSPVDDLPFPETVQFIMNWITP